MVFKKVWLKSSGILCPNICTKPVPRMKVIAPIGFQSQAPFFFLLRIKKSGIFFLAKDGNVWGI